MPDGGGDPAAQSLATQMKDFHPGRSPKPGAFDRHVAALAQQLALPERAYCTGLQAISVVLRGLAHAVASLMRFTLAVFSRPGVLSLLKTSHPRTSNHTFAEPDLLSVRHGPAGHPQSIEMGMAWRLN